MKKEKLNTLQERDIILGLIVSDDFCKEIIPILNPRHLEVEYARTVSTWIKKYYENYNVAPKKDIMKLYRANINDINDEALQDNILSFIQKVDKDYDSMASFNDEYAIQESIKYLKSKSLKNLSQDIESYLLTNDVDKAESLLTKYKKVEKSSGESVSILNDFETVLTSFTEEKDKLFSFNGDFGQLVGDIHREDFISYLAPMKAGKCLVKGTEILMYDGSIKEVQNLQVGDKLMGVDSKPRNVEVVSKGFGRMFRITSNVNPLNKDKTPEIDFTCNGDHILVLKNVWKSRRNKISEFRKDGHKNGELTKHNGSNFLKQDEIEISVNDFLKLSKYEREHFKLFRVRVDYAEKEHKITPYMLGLWLGDGTSSASSLTTTDDEIIKYCIKESLLFNDNITIRNDNSKNTKVKLVRFSPNEDKQSGFRKELSKLNVFKNKHIPNDYLIDSRENRLQLLAGIIDTDGYYNGSYCEICMMNEKLIYDIKKLCQQLGFRTFIKKSYNQYKDMYEETDGWAYSWSIKISGKLSEIPTLLERKKMKDCKKYNSLNNTFSFQITPLEEDNYYGFVIDGDHKFLLADTTVSHNTFSLIDTGIEALKNGLKVVFFSLEMSRTQMIKRIWKTLSGQVTEDMTLEIPQFIEDGNKFVIETKTVKKKASSILDVEKKQKSLKRLFRGGEFIVFAEPAYSLTVDKLETKLDDLEIEGFVPDVIIIDYADIMAPSVKGEYRQQLDSIWKNLRALAQKRKAVVFTASQTNRSGLNGPVELENIAEDIRKVAHITSMVSISRNKYCKEHGIAIYSQLAVRDGEAITKRVIATQCLALGRPVIDSHWESDVILDDFEEDENEDEKSNRKFKK